MGCSHDWLCVSVPSAGTLTYPEAVRFALAFKSLRLHIRLSYIMSYCHIVILSYCHIMSLESLGLRESSHYVVAYMPLETKLKQEAGFVEWANPLRVLQGVKPA